MPALLALADEPLRSISATMPSTVTRIGPAASLVGTLDPKSPEAAQFDASPTRERLGHRVEDRVDDLLRVLAVEVCVLGSDLLDQL
jgi:hypothetical protein